VNFLINRLVNCLAFAGTLNFGALFSNLTKTGVVSPSGSTTFQNSAPATAQALAAASAATAQPGTSDLSNLRIGGSGPIGGSGDDGSTTGSVTDFSPAPTPQPRMITPTFAQASSGGTNPLSNQLTSKGKLLSLILGGAEGAARGAQASLPINGGHTGVGLGPALSAGFETPLVMKSQQNTLAMQQLEQEKEKAQIAALPIQAQTELALKRSQTNWYNNRGEAVGEHNLKSGDTLVDKDGNVIQHGASVADTAQQRETGKLAGTVGAVTNAGGTPIQVLSALGVKNPTDKNTTTAQMYLDNAGGDAGAAIQAMNADRVATSNSINTNIAKLRSVDGGDTPAVSRMVKSDPQYSGYQQQRAALISKMATAQADPFADPKAVTSLQSQTDGLTQKMIARRTALGGTTSGAVPPGPQQPFTHVSSDGHWGWNGTKWVATGR
jgi:hypothetical protein